jgi:hypothetical protein
MPNARAAFRRSSAHGWDRIMIPVSRPDPFGNEGSYFTTGQLPNVEIRPDVAQAFSSRERVVQFFLRHLR